VITDSNEGMFEVALYFYAMYSVDYIVFTFKIILDRDTHYVGTMINYPCQRMFAYVFKNVNVVTQECVVKDADEYGYTK